MLVSALVAVAAVAGASAQPRLHEGDDATSMVQQLVSVESAHPRYAVGDHVFVQLANQPRGFSTSSVVKGSITAVNPWMNTYDVHLWVGTPRKRELHGVPLKLLTDARPAEVREAAQRKAAEEAGIKAEAERRQKLRDEEQERAEQQRVQAELQRRIQEEAKQKAEAEARLRENAEKKQEQEVARAKVEQLIEAEEMRRTAEEKEQARKSALKAKWEAIKVARLKAAGAQHAPPEVQKMVLRGDNYRPRTPRQRLRRTSKTSGSREAEADAEVNGASAENRVHFKVMDLVHNSNIAFTVSRTTPLKAMMAKACERLGISPKHTLFFSGRRQVHPDDSAEQLGLRNGDALTVKTFVKRVTF